MVDLLRSRWAAIGAAVAVTLGGGGLIGVSAADTSSTLVPITPVRVLDTRASDMVGDINDGASITVQVTGSIATVSEGTKTVVPSGASAITGNMTLVSTMSNDYGGYATIYPCGTRPDASNINFTSGQTVANSVAVPLSASGTVCIYVYGTAHVLLDVSGYYTKSEIRDLVEQVSSVESTLASLDDLAVLYDSEGSAYPVYQSTGIGMLQGKWSSLIDARHYVYIEETYWPIGPDGLIPNATLYSHFLSSDCTGDHYVGRSGEFAEDDSYMEIEADWIDEEVNIPLLVMGDDYSNKFPDGEMQRITIDTSDIRQPAEIGSWMIYGGCQPGPLSGSGPTSYVRIVGGSPPAIPSLSAVAP